MNNKLMKFALATIFTIASLSPAFGQVRMPGGNQTNEGTAGFTIGPAPLVDVGPENRGTEGARILRALRGAIGSLETSRLILLTSAGLGVNSATVTQDFHSANLPFETFFVAEAIATTAEVPVATVVNEIHQGASVDVLIDDFDLNVALFHELMLSFTRVFRTESRIANGFILNTQLVDRQFNRALQRLITGFSVIETNVGSDAFSALLFLRLSEMTGLGIDNISAIRVSIPVNVSSGLFAVGILAANSISAGQNVEFNFSASLLSNIGILAAVNTAEIPPSVISLRMKLLASSFAPEA